MLTPADLLDIFESHGIARKKLKEELKLFMQGVRAVSYTHLYRQVAERYVQERGIEVFRPSPPDCLLSVRAVQPRRGPACEMCIRDRV